MSHKRAIEEKHRRKKLMGNRGNAWYDSDKGFYIKYNRVTAQVVEILGLKSNRFVRFEEAKTPSSNTESTTDCSIFGGLLIEFEKLKNL